MLNYRLIILLILALFCSIAFSQTETSKHQQKHPKLILNIEGGFIYPNQTKLIRSEVGNIPNASIQNMKLSNLSNYAAGISIPIMHSFLLSAN